jgi:enoyl-CoA hydratase/carnithine racemase
VSFPEVRVGLVPAMVSPFVLRRLGSARCSSLFLTGDRVSGRDAASAGIIDKHFATVAELDAHVAQVCRSIESCSPDAVAATKRLIMAVDSMISRGATLKELKAFTCSTLANVRDTPAAKEGIQAFLEKRKPNWT